MSTVLNRRRFQRFMLRPMYAPISIRPAAGADAGCAAEGHAYDISEGGIRFEADERFPVGALVAMHITLPTDSADLGPGPTIVVFATIAWNEEDDEHPPYRSAATFTRFARLGDRDRLTRAFSSGRFRLVG